MTHTLTSATKCQKSKVCFGGFKAMPIYAKIEQCTFNLNNVNQSIELGIVFSNGDARCCLPLFIIVRSVCPCPTVTVLPLLDA